MLVEAAPDLVSLVNKVLADVFSFDPRSVSPLEWVTRDPGLQFTGPDPDEWLVGYEQIISVISAQAAEIRQAGGLTFATDESYGWKEGSVGWVVSRGRSYLGDADPIGSKVTVILHEEGPYWKVVHVHYSYSVSNQESLGMELTTAVDDLLLAVRHEDLPPAGMAGDGSVTIAFTDVENSTGLMETLGEPRWLEMLKWHNEIVIQQTAAFGGTVVKGQGDGFMLAFPAAGSAVACATAVQRATNARWDGIPVPIRVGLHAGNASAEGGDFFGRTVVVAARIANAARGGEILASESVQERLAGAFAVGSARSLTLKGLAGAFVAYPVPWE